MEIINELELQKANLEKTFEERRNQVQILDNDIALIEKLLSMKHERNKIMDDLRKMALEHTAICKEINAIKSVDIDAATESK